MKPPVPRFGALAKAAHWLAALLFLLIAAGAMRFAGTDPLDRASDIPIHVTLGFVLLVLLGVLWLFAPGRLPPSRNRPLNPGAARVQARARFISRFLAISLMVQAFMGIAMAAFSPVAIRLFNSGLNLSQFVSSNPMLIELLRPLHFANAVLLIGLAVLHMAFSFWRAATTRDGALVQMVPFAGLWHQLATERTARESRMPSLGRTGSKRSRT